MSVSCIDDNHIYPGFDHCLCALKSIFANTNCSAGKPDILS